MIRWEKLTLPLLLGVSCCSCSCTVLDVEWLGLGTPYLIIALLMYSHDMLTKALILSLSFIRMDREIGQKKKGMDREKNKYNFLLK